MEGRRPLPVPSERLHRLLLSLFASGEAFRQWLSLGPHGQGIVAELPERLASTSSVLFAGIEALRRHGLIDHAFFVRLAQAFPFRADEITRVCGIHLPSDSPQEPSTRRRIRRRLWVVVILGAILPGAYVVRYALTTERALERAGELRFVREGSLPSSTIPDDTSLVHVSSDPPAPPVARAISPKRHLRDESRRRPADAVDSRPAVNNEPVAVSSPNSGCVLSSILKAELHSLAHANLSGPAITERFTVILRPNATQAEVSPRPSPGQTSREQLYSRLLALGPVELGDCRDVPIDVSFSWGRTAMIPRSP